jgi:ubiquinone/menaquinone biosynthesis C-methylase UbiE
MANAKVTTRDARELAYLYDLYIVPGWREAFDSMVDDEVALPKEGKILDAECGTGGFAIELAIKGGEKVEVVGVDSNVDRLWLAHGKAEVKKLGRVTFQPGFLTALGLADDDFDLVIGDASMLPPEQTEAALNELTRVARKGATVALKVTTRGSFDEFFSIYWEALHDLELTEYSPQLERLITERMTISDVEQLAGKAGLKHVRSVTRKEEFDYANAQVFFDAPLIETFFLDGWLAFLPDPETRRRVQDQIAKIINREHHDLVFDVSIKATLIIGQK